MAKTPQNTVPTTEDQSDVIDIKDILSILFDHKWTIVITVFVFLVIGAFYCKFRVPIYQTNYLIKVNSNDAQSNLASMLNKNFSGFSNMSGNPTDTEMALLNSRSVLEPVIQKLDLDTAVSPRYFPHIGHRMAINYNLTNYTNTPAPAAFGFHHYSWGGDTIKVKHFTVSRNLLGKSFVIEYIGNQHYKFLKTNGDPIAEGTVGKPLTWNPDHYTQLHLTIAQIHARQGVYFIISKKHMVDTLNQLNGKLKISQPNPAASVIEMKMVGTNPAKITHILNAIGQSAISNSVARKAYQAAQTLAFLKNRIPSVKKQLTKAEKRLNQYREKSGTIDLKAQTKALLTQLGTIETNISTMEIQKEQLQQQYTAQSVQLQQINTVISQLDQQKNALVTKLKQQPETDQGLVNLMRNVTVQNAVYTALQSNIQQYELMKASTIGDLTTIDQANVPYHKINKSGSIVVLLYGFIGLILSLAFIFTRQFLWKGIDDPNVLEQKFDLPVFGTLHISKLHRLQMLKHKKGLIKHLKLLAEIDPHDVVVESLRSLRTSLLFKLPNAKNNIVTISSPTPNEGKSFTCANLAQVLADSGKKVLLIDADIRRGDLYKYFTNSRKNGLSELIMGKKTIDEVIHHTRIPNLDFLSTGAFPTKHAELLMQPECEKTLSTLAKQYDLVLIDTAPVLAVTDAFVLNRYAGMKLLMVAHNRHPDRAIYTTIDRYHKAGMDLDGAIFNLVPLAKSAGYRYGGKYAYKYQYRYDSRTKK